MNQLHELKKTLEPYRRSLIEHTLYQSIEELDDLQQFMQAHVFAVWDFMSLLKTLQRELTCTETPWQPATNPLACRLINEIVLGEESDEDQAGGYGSHFELYHEAMTACCADTSAIDLMLAELKTGQSIQAALTKSEVSTAIKEFTLSTFQWIEKGDIVELASAFTFGREDLLPDVFRKIVERLDRQSSGQLQPFLYYLQRHIELDEDRHGPMADQLMIDLCGDDDSAWDRAEQAAVHALEMRIRLWDEITANLSANPASTC